jgi:hypothetical protein
MSKSYLEESWASKADVIQIRYDIAMLLSGLAVLVEDQAVRKELFAHAELIAKALQKTLDEAA